MMGRSRQLPTLSPDGPQRPCAPDLTGFTGRSLPPINKESNSTAVEELTPMSVVTLRQFFEILDQWDLCEKEKQQ